MAKNVLVVGSGIAGLTAARTLKRAGYGVQVVDKGRRVGGRCNTRRVKDTLHFDHGAQYFTARDPEFSEQTQDWLRRGVVARWPARFAVADRGQVTAKIENPSRYVGTPGMRKLAEDLATGLDVSTGVRVASLRREAQSWCAIDEAGAEQGRGERVIVTAPPPQSLGLVKHSEPLSAMCLASRMAPCWALMVEFADRVETEFDALFFEHEPLRFAARDSSKPGRSDGERWVLHATDAWSETNVEASTDAVEAQLLAGFWQGLGLPDESPRVAVAHRWRYATPTPSAECGSMFDAARGLALAGDWLGGSRIEGAYLSGLDVARQMIASDC